MTLQPDIRPTVDAIDPANLNDPWTPLRQRLVRHARMVVHEPALAEDLAQETLISVLESPQAHRGEASLTTWATAILKNKIADWYRSPHQRRRVHNAADDDETDPTEGLFNEQGSYLEAVPVWQQPDGREAQRQIMHTLESCLRCLPAQTSRVFMMREWLGFETSEICERLGLSADNCRMVLHRARTGLRQCMTSHGHTARSAA
ncbi:MAG: RNA polymerase subunit sigma [Betaproteobacteria bacterium HGW-Betaproteobacteria-16]|nr:MAG: RNA polymerase subunit sigma [Betaproteobacteria bacterium HGW-Betaproteobacteria-16]